MKAITIWQPWATLIAIGAKRYETRTWDTSHRGPLAIHAAKKILLDAACCDIHPQTMEIGGGFVLVREKDGGYTLRTGYDIEAIVFPLPLGAVVATCEIEATGYTENVPVEERILGDFSPGRFAWKLANVQPIHPVPARGTQRLWNWDPATTGE
jgi:hypothetical protein